MTTLSSVRGLVQLARLYNIQTAYYDVFHQRQQVSREALLAILQSLGAPVASWLDVSTALRERQQVLWQRVLEPVNVAWNGHLPAIEIRLPSNMADVSFDCTIKLESSDESHWRWHGGDFPILQKADIEGKTYIIKQLSLPGPLPWGYHHLFLELGGQREESMLISCPFKTYNHAKGRVDHRFGMFIPLYALHSEKSWGGGDFADLDCLASWIARQGGQVVATLPLLAAFLDKPYEPSPYLPVSRLLWNEFYLDINDISELYHSPSSQELLAAPSFQKEISKLKNSPLVKYKEQMALKRRVLEQLCQQLFHGQTSRTDELHRFIKENPVIADYARFRAACEKYDTSWKEWPLTMQQGHLGKGDYNEENKQYHLYVQWLAHQQIEKIVEKVSKRNQLLYLDLPLGVHPEGYDAWRERESFITDTAMGAPPDGVYNKGQNWSGPPPHPEKIREQHYRYIIACLRHQFKLSGILRIDHVMGLHRIYCIPNGFASANGTYLRYHSDEIYAILSLESHRHKTTIVGEDLGTVPEYVRMAMRKHGLSQMYVVQYELASNPKEGLPSIKKNSVTSLNTHDMPPFAAFWQGMDIELRRKIGLLNKQGIKREKDKLSCMRIALLSLLHNKGLLNRKEEDIDAILIASLLLLTVSKTSLVLANLEDLWLETKPQNVPGTDQECPNWQNKARYNIEKFCQMPEVIDKLNIISQLRKSGRVNAK